MKIVQSRAWGDQLDSITGAAYEDCDLFFHFEPELYSGITAIYFEAQGRITNTSGSLDVKLKDFTNTQDIAELNFNTTSRERQRSADIKSLLTTVCDLGFAYRRNTIGTGKWQGARLIIEQEDNTTSRKTVTYFPMAQHGYTSSTTYIIPFNSASAGFVNPRIESFDGIVKAYFDLFLQTVSGGTAYARLYDSTIGEAVAGSEVTTISTTEVHVRSGEITLITGHIYKIQVKNGTALKSAHAFTASIMITAQGFSKIVSVPCPFGINYIDENESMAGNGDINLFEPAKIDGIDGLTYEFDQNLHSVDADVDPANLRLYNITAAAAVVGTEHEITYAGDVWTLLTDNLTIPEADSELELQYDFWSIYLHGPACIVAIQQENFGVVTYLPADPLQPTGYHCFMSQYVKNALAGNIPMLTPDGVNRCW